MSASPCRQPFISGESIFKCLHECIRTKCLSAARTAHSAAIIASLEKVPELRDLLIHAYAHGASLGEAYSVFVRALQPTTSTWQAIITAHVKLGNPRRAFTLYRAMWKQGTTPNTWICLFIIKACTSVELFELGMLVHVHVIQLGMDWDVALCTTLVDMYAKYGSMEDAHGVFLMCPRADSVLWGALISGFVQHGEDLMAITFFSKMREKRIDPDRFGYACILKALGNVQAVRKGMEIHNQIVVCRYERDKVIGSTLVDMYAKCGALQEARKVFNSLTDRDNVLWCSMLAGYAQHGHGLDAFHLFQNYLNKGMRPDIEIYTSVLKACTRTLDPTHGRLIHEHIVKVNLDQNEAIGNALLNMYFTSKSLKDAQAVFNEMRGRGLIAWNTMIATHADHGNVNSSLELFEKMQHEGICVDFIAVTNVLRACTVACGLEEGNYIHDHVTKLGLETARRVGNTLIDMYAKCNRLEEACAVFDGMPNKDVVSWNAVISGCLCSGHSCFALTLFAGMHDVGLQPDAVTLSSIAKACGDLGELVECFVMHVFILECGCGLDIHTEISIIDMYCKAGLMDEACKLFDSLPTKTVATWNLMMGGYLQQGLALPALKTFEKMDQQDVIPDNITFVSALRACGMLGVVVDGRQIHGDAVLSGQSADTLVANTLVDMYMKCGAVLEAQRLFDLLHCKDIVAWNAMLAGLSQLEDGQTVLDLYQKMEVARIQPDEVTLSSVVKACITSKLLKQAQLFHIKAVTLGLESKTVINSSLLDLYASYSMLDEAQKVLQSLGSLSLVSSNEMVAGFAKHGFAHPAFTTFKELKEDGSQPDVIAYSSILKACNNREALEQGRFIHSRMTKNGTKLDEVAVSALVDMYSRCGSLTEARQVFDGLPDRDIVIWNAMMEGYIQHKHFLPAFELFAALLQEGFQPDQVMISCVSRVCCLIGAVGYGLVLHDQILRSGFDADPFIRSCLLGMYDKLGRLQEARCVVLGSKSCKPESWLSMIAAHVEQNEYEWAHRFVDAIQQHHGKPCEESEENAPMKTVEQQHIIHMHAEHGLVPSTQHFHYLIDLLGHTGCLSEAERIMRTIPPLDVFAGWKS